MPELALKVRAVDTLFALFAVVPCATTIVIRSPTCMALYLRRKIQNSSARPLIHTIRGVGYELSARSGAQQFESSTITPKPLSQAGDGASSIALSISNPTS